MSMGNIFTMYPYPCPLGQPDLLHSWHKVCVPFAQMYRFFWSGSGPGTLLHFEQIKVGMISAKIWDLTLASKLFLTNDVAIFTRRISNETWLTSFTKISRLRDISTDSYAKLDFSLENSISFFFSPSKCTYKLRVGSFKYSCTAFMESWFRLRFCKISPNVLSWLCNRSLMLVKVCSISWTFVQFASSSEMTLPVKNMTFL